MTGWIAALIIAVLLTTGVYMPASPGMDSIRSAYSASAESEDHEWREYHALALSEYEDEFTALFNSYETKWAKNGRLMMRTGDSGPYKFVKKV